MTGAGGLFGAMPACKLAVLLCRRDALLAKGR